MADLVFPIDKCPIPPWDASREDVLLRSPQEAGYIISRPRFPEARREFVFNWEYLTDDENKILDNFYMQDTVKGSKSFIFNIKSVYINESYKVQFTSPPKCQYVGMGLWRVTCNMREV